MRQRLAGGQNDVWRQRDQFRGIFAIVFGIGYGKAIINPHIVALGPAQLLQPLLECREAYLVLLIVHGRGREHTDAPHRGRLLRARRERPRRGGAEQCDERAPLHSITSSARARIPGGNISPIALAVLRLTASSNLTGCSTGRSAGLAPCKILCT